MVRFAWFVMIAACLSAGNAVAQQGDQLVRARLLADVAAIEPGKPFAVGVLFTIQPKWHIYWKNPGDAGMPTEVKFSLPPGFQASDLHWPVPMAFEQPAGMRDYGYESSVLLMATVTPPDTLKPGQTVTLKARAQWLACEKVCLPGDQDLSLSLPVAQAAQPATTAGVFAQWRPRLPVDASTPDSPVRVEAEGQIAPDAREGRFKLTVRPRQGALRDVALYPLPPDSLSIEQIEVHPDPTGATLAFKASLLAGARLEQPLLPIVIGFTDINDQRRGVIVHVPLRPDPQP